MFATSLETYENQSVAAVQQARKITGTLTDAVGEPIIGATVLEKGNPSNGTITDINGKFSLSVHPNAVISISYIGYITQNIKITNQTSLKVVMMDDTQALEEVVVVGYGSQKKANLTGGQRPMFCPENAKERRFDGLTKPTNRRSRFLYVVFQMRTLEPSDTNRTLYRIAHFSPPKL